MTKSYRLIIGILIGLAICAIFAPQIAPHDPQYVDITMKLAPSSAEHLLGTDHLGRDILSRLLYGARFSLALSLTLTSLELLMGFSIGLSVGWYQGRLEKGFLWVTNILSAFPSFLLALATAGILGQGLLNLVIAIVSVEWIFYARIVASMVKKVKSESYVLVAQTMGFSTIYILKRHILPFIYKPILVIALMNVGNLILMISSFSFLGIGVQPNVAEWDIMLFDARPYFRTNPGLMVYPGLAIFLTVFAFNQLGDFFEKKGWQKA